MARAAVPRRSAPRRVPLPLRGAGLMPAAALAVHQLRYQLAYGGHASGALAQQGHAYLGSLVPWIVLAAGLSLGATIGRLAERWSDGGAARVAPRAAFVRTWLLVALTLLAIFSAQELLEGAFASGHLAGLAAVVGAGGWWAAPAALLVGGALALALRGVHAAEAALDALRPRVRSALRAPIALLARAAASFAAPLAPLARDGAGRAPPRARLSLA